MRNREEAAKIAYHSAVRIIKSAKDYDADAAKAATPEKSAKAHDKAQKAYQDAITKLIDVVGLDPKMYEAWNYLGFANRHLGHYEDALSSYEKALELNPAYADAIEYRGEAYLGLNQIDDAKGAYMALFRDSRPLANELMTRDASVGRRPAQGRARSVSHGRRGVRQMDGRARKRCGADRIARNRCAADLEIGTGKFAIF